ncbi:MAG: PaaI family thioesterase [Pseudomonadota bacterium]|nr:PaaI family thioesterase [Pseudomonadota bacterium]
MDVLTRALKEGSSPDPSALLSAIPYCRHLGISAELREGGLVLVMPFADHLVGNVFLPALHGGVIGSLLETAAVAQVIWEIRGPRLPRPVDITIDYLRSARAVTSYARARIAKQGRRVVNVHAEMWQDDEARPVAALRGHMLLSASA